MQRLETTNSTCWNSLKARLLETDANAVMGQELKLDGAEVRDAQAWAKANGLKAAITHCIRTDGGGASGGTGIFVRKATGLEQVISGSWQAYPGRATAAKANMGPKGGMLLASLYLIDGIGPTAEGNWKVLLKMAELLKHIAVLWICGADWNCTPQELVDSGWLTLVGGKIIAVADAIGTCKTTSDRFSNIDYFVVPLASAPIWDPPEALRESAGQDAPTGQAKYAQSSQEVCHEAALQHQTVPHGGTAKTVEGTTPMASQDATAIERGHG